MPFSDKIKTTDTAEFIIKYCCFVFANFSSAMPTILQKHFVNNFNQVMTLNYDTKKYIKIVKKILIRDIYLTIFLHDSIC